MECVRSETAQLAITWSRPRKAVAPGRPTRLKLMSRRRSDEGGMRSMSAMDARVDNRLQAKSTCTKSSSNSALANTDATLSPMP